ncbi:MAG TPA: YkgJ family cysteine cluster protein, partial [Acidimicrobiia bacterium]|nr:YkgJ family cysteine cluster protein [Acidimicrobiia bacterium]
MSEDRDLAAGDFSSWMAEVQGAIHGGQDAVVPCDGCTACCTSSQFIHIAPDEVDTLSRIPAELLFAAPRLPPGNVLLGYDERGHCPMLVDNTCSIYAHRPRTCRTYDCRIFPASGIELDDDDKAQIADQARRWRFEFPTQTALDQRDAVRAAATFIEEHPDLLPDGATAANGTQRAVLAIELHAAFLRGQTPVRSGDRPTAESHDDVRLAADIDRGRADAVSNDVARVGATVEDDHSVDVTTDRADIAARRDDVEKVANGPS